MALHSSTDRGVYMRVPSRTSAADDPRSRPPQKCSPGLPYFNPQLASPADNIQSSISGDSDNNRREDVNEVYQGSPVHYCPAESKGSESEKRFAFHKHVPAASFLGLQDFLNPEVWRAAISEFVVIAIFIFVSTAGAISSLQGGFTSAMAAVALIEFFTMSFIILAAVPASGSHLNPAVTIATMLIGFSTPVRALLYVVAQCAGSVVGAAAVKVVIANDIAVKYSLGGCFLRNNITVNGVLVEVGISTGSGLVSEFVFTLTVLYIAFSVTMDPKQFQLTGPILAPFMIGAVIGLLIFISSGLMDIPGGYPGAAMNPARCLGPAVAMGGSLWTDHWVFWVGPILSSVAFSIVYHFIPPHHVELYQSRKDIFTKMRILLRIMSSDPPISNKQLTLTESKRLHLDALPKSLAP